MPATAGNALLEKLLQTFQKGGEAPQPETALNQGDDQTQPKSPDDGQAALTAPTNEQQGSTAIANNTASGDSVNTAVTMVEQGKTVPDGQPTPGTTPADPGTESEMNVDVKSASALAATCEKFASGNRSVLTMLGAKVAGKPAGAKSAGYAAQPTAKTAQAAQVLSALRQKSAGLIVDTLKDAEQDAELVVGYLTKLAAAAGQPRQQQLVRQSAGASPLAALLSRSKAAMDENQGQMEGGGSAQDGGAAAVAADQPPAPEAGAGGDISAEELAQQLLQAFLASGGTPEQIVEILSAAGAGGGAPAGDPTAGGGMPPGGDPMAGGAPPALPPELAQKVAHVTAWAKVANDRWHQLAAMPVGKRAAAFKAATNPTARRVFEQASKTIAEVLSR